MVSKRNQFIELLEYIGKYGISVNIGKNKARGNKGVFCVKGNNDLRIDVSKIVSDEEKLSIVLHEFAHYVHYVQDKSLQSLTFIFDDMTDAEMEELINVTVYTIPKETAKNLYQQKYDVDRDIKSLSTVVKTSYPNFKLSMKNIEIENSIKYPLKYLLKYDSVKYQNKIYSVDDIEVDFPNTKASDLAYIKLKSRQRFLTRINSKINRLNKYYNAPTELWARFCELYYLDNIKANIIAPNLSMKMKATIDNMKIKELVELDKIFSVQ